MRVTLRNVLRRDLRAALYAVVIGLLTVSGCGARGPTLDSIGAPGTDATGRCTTARDGDRDGIPDAVELTLGTDPASIDTDGDGLTDHYELWGVNGLPVGTLGSLSGLPDADGDGVIAALDRAEAGTVVLKNASALDQERVRVAFPDVDPQPENDLDDDWIPTDFELNGFYYEMDPLTGEDWFVKWDGDLTRNYFKTDPTKWSTDGDPWSDWEEATKINMDQRVKHPGDHPCIPAYPEIYASLVSYTIELNQDEQIETSEGGTTAESWTNSVISGWERTTEQEDLQGGYHEFSPSEYLTPEDEFTGLCFWFMGGSVHVEAGYKGEYHHKTVKLNISETTEENSGLSKHDWATARTVSRNTLEVARIILNIKLVNVGTLPAHHPRMLFNLRIGNFATHQVLVEYPGELEAKARNPVDWVVASDGIASLEDPGGSELMLSVYQLRSIQCGAPLMIEPVSFEAETLVAVLDPQTGRRAYITTGAWSPYEAAIQNVTARLALDFSEVPELGQPLFHGMAARKVSDVRVFAYSNTGHYLGSPPKVNLTDALIWAFESVQTMDGPVSTIRDPISGNAYRVSTAGWRFSFDAQVLEHIINEEPEYLGNVFDLPLESGNPHERTYLIKAPSPTAQKPRIHWATVNPLQRVIRAYSFDPNGVKEMRFKPSDDYPGELMVIGIDPRDPHQQFFYTYRIPPQYKWQGVEKVVAINRYDAEAELPIEFESDQLGFEVDSGTFSIPWTPSGAADESFTGGLNLEGPGIGDPPYDVELKQMRVGDGELTAKLSPLNGAAIYDIEVVADVNQIDYNYLRKRPYQEVELGVPLEEPLYPVDDPAYYHVFAVRTKTGSVALFVPQLTLRGLDEYYVSAVDWTTYEGL